MRPKLIGIHALLAVAAALAACSSGPGEAPHTSASQDLVPNSLVSSSATDCAWGQFHDVSPVGALSGGGPITAITRYGGGQTDVYAVGGDGRIYTAWWNTAAPPTTAPQWVPISTPGTAAPGQTVAALTRYPNTIDLYVVGNDGKIYTMWWNDGDNPGWFSAPAWKPISTVGTSTTHSSVAAITRYGGSEIDLYVVGNDGKIYTQWWNDQNHTIWFNASPWSPISTTGTASPRASVTAITRYGGSEIDLYVVGNDGKIYMQWWNDQNHTTWFAGGPWTPLSTPGTAPLNAPVTALTRRPTEIDLYVVGNDGKIYTMWWNDGDNPGWFAAPAWKPISPAYTALPGTRVAASSRSPAQIDLFVSHFSGTPDGGIYTQWWNDDMPDHNWFNQLPWNDISGGGVITGGSTCTKDSQCQAPYQCFAHSCQLPTWAGEPVTALTLGSTDIDLFTLGSTGTAVSARLTGHQTYFPHYRVAGLYYSPPGQGSTARYTTGTTSGTRTEAKSTNSGGGAVQVTTPIGEVDQNWQIGTEDGSSTEITKTTASSLGVNSSQDAINHDLDTFYFWTNSQVDICDYGTVAQQAWSNVSGQGFAMIDVMLGELLGHMPPRPGAQQLLALLTPDEISAIARLDPWSTGPAPVLDPGRFAPVPNTSLFVEGPGKDAGGTVSHEFTVGYDQKVGQIHGTTAGQQATVLIGDDFTVFGLSFGAKGGPSYSYSYENTTESTTGTQQQADITLTGAATDLSVPVDTYFDAAFGSYAFVPRGVDVTELRLQGSWIGADLTAMINAYPAMGRITGYVTPDQIPRVVYRGLDTHIHEMRLQGGWIHADLSAIVGGGVPAPAAEGDPAAYVTPDGTPRIVYAGTDAHIHELRLVPGGWFHADLSAIVLGGGTAPAALGDPSAYVTRDGVARVLYSGEDQHVHELRLQNGWIHADISIFTTNGPPALTGRGARTFGYVDPGGVARVVYAGADKHVHELSLQGSWLQADLTAAAGGTASTVAGDPFGYVTPDKVAKVVYQGTDLDIHELRLTGQWYDADLSGIAADGRAPAAGGAPFAYFAQDGVPRVVYRGLTGDILELHLTGSWYWADLSQITSDGRPAPAIGDPTAYVTPDGVPRVLYR